MPSCRDGGDLSSYGSFSKVGHEWRRTRGTHGRSGVQVAIQMLLAWLANQDTRSGVQVAIQMLLKWRRTRGTHGGRQKYCRPVAMEAICQPGYYVRRRAWAVFPKSETKRGQPSSGRWRQENAAGEAAERMSALSGIGAGTSKSMAMAAGEDDADKFKSGGVLTCSASV